MGEFNSKSIIKGGILFELFQWINHLKSLNHDLDYLKKNAEMEYPAMVLTNLSSHFAYDSILNFMDEELNIKSYEKEDFQNKSFRGAKVLNIINYLDFEIRKCNNAINSLNFVKFDGNFTSPNYLIEHSAIMNHYETQIEIYKTIKELVVRGIVNKNQHRINFFGLWMQIKSEKTGGEVQ